MRTTTRYIGTRGPLPAVGRRRYVQYRKAAQPPTPMKRFPPQLWTDITKLHMTATFSFRLRVNSGDLANGLYRR